LDLVSTNFFDDFDGVDDGNDECDDGDVLIDGSDDNFDGVDGSGADKKDK
jgi:hypothetical protein